jgi:hypothetical protein
VRSASVSTKTIATTRRSARARHMDVTVSSLNSSRLTGTDAEIITYTLTVD